MAVEFPIAVLISSLKNGFTISTNYSGATFTTRALDGLDNTQDEIVGDKDLPAALRTHADMIEKHR